MAKSKKKVIKPDIAELVLGISQRVDDLHSKFDDKTEGLGKKIDDLKTSVDDKFKGHNDYHINYEKRITKILIIGGSILTGVTAACVLNRLDIIPKMFTWIWQLLLKLL